MDSFSLPVISNSGYRKIKMQCWSWKVTVHILSSEINRDVGTLAWPLILRKWRLNKSYDFFHWNLVTNKDLEDVVNLSFITYILLWVATSQSFILAERHVAGSSLFQTETGMFHLPSAGVSRPILCIKLSYTSPFPLDAIKAACSAD